ncbi:MAG: TrkA family potassium uptake protein [Acutalibacteraceae bacterium]|nr:TrkA family potassium uptake protein [Clostridia bacterium]MEE1139670.1 TrkA family potassium uptake protein [Acutalibacteraceae bacterium]
MKSFLIIGMGHFGHHLCRSLAETDCEIMIVDQNEEALEDMLPYVVSAKIGDCTNIEVLKTFDIPSFDACFVCIGENFQNSLEITSQLKECGAKKVISKADRDIQEKFLLRNGADEVIYPEKNMAERYAVTESSEHIFNFINLGSDYSIYEIDILDRWVGKTVKELNFRVKYNLAVLATKKDGEVKPVISGDRRFEKGEHLLVLGKEEDVHKVTK